VKENILMSMDKRTNANKQKEDLTCYGSSGKQPLLEKSFNLSCQKMSAVNHAKIISVYGKCNKTV
jgi:hypothetical protein